MCYDFIYDWCIWWWNDRLFFYSCKENDNCAIDWLTLLARTFSRYLISSYYITEDEYSKYSVNQIRIHTMVYLYSIYVSKDNNTKCVLNPFSWSIWTVCYALFKHVWWTVCLHSRKCIQLKRFGSDKLLDSVLRLIYISVTAYVH